MIVNKQAYLQRMIFANKDNEHVAYIVEKATGMPEPYSSMLQKPAPPEDLDCVYTFEEELPFSSFFAAFKKLDCEEFAGTMYSTTIGLAVAINYINKPKFCRWVLITPPAGFNAEQTVQFICDLQDTNSLPTC